MQCSRMPFFVFCFVFLSSLFALDFFFLFFFLRAPLGLSAVLDLVAVVSCHVTSREGAAL